ncbi:MAG: bacteriohopanetetrol glucosamine biosynthesis glycosyltransferase HpnI [Proteobacteria bacterium]|nr:bacteriohopanetetrol glucosamine biosynthesis glycosyltransferase HpnI [Pseudomonadota bacterium]
MPAHPVELGLGLLLLLVAAGYQLTSTLAAAAWRIWSALARVPQARPPVTILKPLCGEEPGLYENLRSFCVQDYPLFQVVFGVRDGADPAAAAVARLQREFPDLDLVLVVEPALHGANRKISNLMNMLPHARHGVLLIADSDARVTPGYLRTVAPPLADPGVGLVTSLYTSVPAGGLWSRLGAMYINDWYMPSVMVAWLFGHRRYASGQTLGIRRDTLEALGGFGSIVNHLADDYQLGENVRRLGGRIVLTPYVPFALQDEPDAAALMTHELRWMRTIRVLAPRSFAFLAVTFTLPLLLIGARLTSSAAAASAAWLLPLIGAVFLCRCLTAALTRLPRERLTLADLALLPVRDLLLVVPWARALATSRIAWRGSAFTVDPGGVMRGSP